MKFKVKAEEFLSALKSTAELLKEKKANPILGYYLIRVEDDFLSVTTSCDDGASITIPIPADKELTDSCSFCAPQKIKDVVSLIKGEIEITYEESGIIAISYASGNTELSCVSANDYIQKEFETTAPEYSAMEISGKVLKDGFSFCAPFCSTAIIRPVMCSIHLEIADGNATIVGTDAVTLAISKAKVEGCPALSCNVVGKYASILCGLIGDENINLQFNGNAIRFSNSKFAFVSPLAIGNYPNYGRIIPAAEIITAKTTLKKADLLHTATMVGVCTSAAKLVKMVVSGENVTLSGEDLDNGSKASGFSSCLFSEFTIGVNNDKLIDTLRQIPAENIEICFTDASRPLLIKPVDNDDYLVLLMPVSL